MIKEIKSNNPKFKSIVFNEGFNVILADREKTDDKDDIKKSRNGSGKTTLIEIIHFCLGARVDKKSIFKSAYLKDWTFTIVIDINSSEFEFTRYTNTPNKIYIIGDKERLNFDLLYDKKEHKYYASPSTLNNCLLTMWFGLEKENKNRKYTPSFRELISYLVRRTSDGFRSAFEYFPKQKTYSVQECNAYFLGLNLDYASQFQEIKDKVKGIQDYKKAAKSGVIGELKLNIGELNSDVITRERENEKLKMEIDTFKVHPQYYEVNKEANELTKKLHEAANTISIKKQLLDRYIDSVQKKETEVPLSEIESIYKEAGVIFGENLKKNLDEVLNFHQTIVRNRKEYLSNEIINLKKDITTLEANIEIISQRRSEIMKILSTHGALEEYTIIQERYTVAKQDLEEAKKKLKTAEYIEDTKSYLKIENQELLIKSRQDYSERKELLEKSISLFKANSEYLYSEPGVLTVDLTETGYKFDVNIKRAKSQGVSYMKVFCYDLMLMEIGKYKTAFPKFLVHDSTIFDGVDERQIALALKLAKQKSEESGFQYICLLNSDNIPETEFEEDFKEQFFSFVVKRISDASEDTGLLGMRF